MRTKETYTIVRMPPWKQRHRTYASYATYCSLVLIFYLAPLIHLTNEHVIQGNIPANQIIADTKEWMLGNRIRFMLEFAGFLFSIIALHTWTKESNYKVVPLLLP